MLVPWIAAGVISAVVWVGFAVLLGLLHDISVSVRRTDANPQQGVVYRKRPDPPEVTPLPDAAANRFCPNPQCEAYRVSTSLPVCDVCGWRTAGDDLITRLAQRAGSLDRS